MLDRFDDELIGLDRDDPEVQAFAAHLDRLHRQHPAFTVEGYLDDVGTFVDSVHRAEGERDVRRRRRRAPPAGRRRTIIWDVLTFVFTTWL